MREEKRPACVAGPAEDIRHGLPRRVANAAAMRRFDAAPARKPPARDSRGRLLRLYVSARRTGRAGMTVPANGQDASCGPQR